MGASMIIKSFVDEDFVNYRKPSMFIITPTCSFKCDKENGCLMCQNSRLVHEPTHDVETDVLIIRYLENPITKAVVFGGLEPFDTPHDLVEFIQSLRWDHHCDDDIVIYTGYTEEELEDTMAYKIISSFNNIIVKFGRFRPNQMPHYDEVLGVNLASDNQYAKKVSNDEV
jgi:organic radical activating enzyme